MGYIQNVSEQLKVFLYSLGMGFLMGIIYDLFRTLRIIFSPGKAGVYIQDFLYVVTVAFATFIFSLVLNDGKIMMYLIVGEVLGWVVYYFSFGTISLRISAAIVAGTKAAVKLIKKPVLFMLGKLKTSLKKVGEKTKIKSKKLSKNANFLLKKQCGMLYTLNRVICSGETKEQYAKKGCKDVRSTAKKEKDI